MPGVFVICYKPLCIVVFKRVARCKWLQYEKHLPNTANAWRARIATAAFIAGIGLNVAEHQSLNVYRKRHNFVSAVYTNAPFVYTAETK